MRGMVGRVGLHRLGRHVIHCGWLDRARRRHISSTSLVGSHTEDWGPQDWNFAYTYESRCVPENTIGCMNQLDNFMSTAER